MRDVWLGRRIEAAIEDIALAVGINTATFATAYSLLESFRDDSPLPSRHRLGDRPLLRAGLVITATGISVVVGYTVQHRRALGAPRGLMLGMVLRQSLWRVPGDDDGVVTCADAAIVKAAFGKRLGQPGFDARADLNGDRAITIVDLSTVTRALPAGTTCS